MPKTGIFDDTITFSSLMELREKLTALGWLQGDPDFSTTARNLLMRAVDEEILKLEPGKRREFNQILDNVRAQTVIKRQEKQEKAMRVSTAPDS